MGNEDDERNAGATIPTKPVAAQVKVNRRHKSMSDLEIITSLTPMLRTCGQRRLTREVEGF